MGKRTYSGVVKSYLQALERRSDFLAERVANNHNGKDLSYDKRELAALNWAIDFIQKHLK